MAVIGHLVPALAALIPGIPRVLGAGREVGVGYNSVPVQWHALLLMAWIVADWRVIVTPEAVHTGPARAAGVALPGEAFPGGGCAAAPAVGPAAGHAGIGGPLPVGGGLRHQQPLRWRGEAFIHLGQSASEVGQRQPFWELEEVRQPRCTCPRWGKTHRTVWQEPH